jgi:hypothetical protein
MVVAQPPATYARGVKSCETKPVGGAGNGLLTIRRRNINQSAQVRAFGH